MATAGRRPRKPVEPSSDIHLRTFGRTLISALRFGIWSPQPHLYRKCWFGGRMTHEKEEQRPSLISTGDIREAGGGERRGISITTTQEQTTTRATMCIAAWVWQAHPRYPLILLLNRDEYYSRPTEEVAWWEWGGQSILGGKDVEAGGTWMGCTRDGKLAFLTNVLEPDVLPIAKSRGDLPVRFLESGKSPLEFAEELVLEADQYNGFNLVLADLRAKTMVYVSNRPKGVQVTVQVVAPGLHVLANAHLDTPWPKAQRLAKGFRDLLYKYPDDEIPVRVMIELMGDRVRPSKEKIPKTGCNPDLDLKLSSIFVGTETSEQELFGTRSQAAVTMGCNGEVIFYERYLDGNKWKEHTLEYIIEKG